MQLQKVGTITSLFFSLHAASLRLYESLQSGRAGLGLYHHQHREDSSSVPPTVECLSLSKPHTAFVSSSARLRILLPFLPPFGRPLADRILPTPRPSTDGVAGLVRPLSINVYRKDGRLPFSFVRSV